jgi:hypothetical protein
MLAVAVVVASRTTRGRDRRTGFVTAPGGVTSTTADTVADSGAAVGALVAAGAAGGVAGSFFTSSAWPLIAR